MEYAKISIEPGRTASDFPEGKVEVWWWKDKKGNTLHKATSPIWDFLEPESIYCLVGELETIEVPVRIINNFFEEVE